MNDLVRALAEEEDKLLACVHCGFCLPACPTYNRLGSEADSPRGRLHLMRAVVEGRLEPDDSGFDLHIDRCLGCRMCEPVCPAGVRYGFLLERARTVIAESRGVRPPVRAMLAVFRRRRLMRLVLGSARLVRDSGIARVLFAITPRALRRARLGLAMLIASAPRPGPKQVAAVPAARGRPAGVPTAADRTHPDAAATPPTTAVLRGCVQESLFSRVNRATEEALAARGCDVVHPARQGCCGALHAHAGLLDDARALARANVRAFDASGAEQIVVNAAGCGAFMKEYGELLHDDADLAAAAARVASRTRDLAEVLAPAGDGAVPAPSATESPRLRVAYDEACHLHHGQGVHVEPYRVLESIASIELVPLERATECCGGAGIYGLTHPDLGGRILDDKIDAIQRARPDVVATANPGCAMQIGAGLLLRGDATPVVHPAELVRREAASRGSAPVPVRP